MDRGSNKDFANPESTGDRMATIVNVLQSPEAGTYCTLDYKDGNVKNVIK